MLYYIVFRLVAEFVSLFGIKSAGYFGKMLGLVFYYLIPIRKSVVIENLTRAFPDLSQKKIKNICKKNYQSFGITLCEIFALQRETTESIKTRFFYSDSSPMTDITPDSGRAVMLTGHFGNWELGAIAAAFFFNREITVLYKKQSNRYISEWMVRLRQKFGNKTVALGVSVREIYKVIKEEGIIGIVGDQRGPREAVKVDFMGIPTSVYTGTAEIALKTNTPIYMVFTIRQKDCRYEFRTLKLDYTHLPGSFSEKAVKICEIYMAELSKIIREHPEQWFWMHKIWKY